MKKLRAVRRWRQINILHAIITHYHRLHWYIGDVSCHGEIGTLTTCKNLNPWTDCHKICYSWLCPRVDITSQMW